jgi:hypothetical protein
VWTVVANGKPDRAVATLNPLSEMDDTVIAMNRNFNAVENNKPPAVKLTASASSVAVTDSVTLTASVSDDGLPKPPAGRVGAGGASAAAIAAAAAAFGMRPPGLSVKWMVYRGPANVKFTPERTQVPSDGKSVSNGQATASASFIEPGDYVLRAFADDGSLFGTADVSVKVTGTAGAQKSGR